MLKLIQLGLTFTDAEGNLPVCNGEHTVWQFNFRGFKLSEDVYAQDSIELLKQSGIDFGQVGSSIWFFSFLSCCIPYNTTGTVGCLVQSHVDHPQLLQWVVQLG